jgi:hypothetical protein
MSEASLQGVDVRVPVHFWLSVWGVWFEIQVMACVDLIQVMACVDLEFEFLGWGIGVMGVGFSGEGFGM